MIVYKTQHKELRHMNPKKTKTGVISGAPEG